MIDSLIIISYYYNDSIEIIIIIKIKLTILHKIYSNL